MKILSSSIDKGAVALMPRVQFEGRIEVVRTRADMVRALRFLRRQHVVGIDTETRPSFSADKVYQVALLQVSTLDVCFLFRLNYLGLPEELLDFLSSDDCLKVGLSLRDDIRSLCGRASFSMGSYMELQQEAARYGLMDRSLLKLYANLFHQRISKRQQLSNWEAKELTDAQKVYAATDAWACLKIYRCFENFKKYHNYKTISPVDETRLQEHVVQDMLAASLPHG
ncbi:MAG: 3'-5' exonuclease domain-containing protein 2 [Bacteroidaceae bacterium]|nr:3'-5' exonuclease domain-containing protein 2 [Bacteroidaceae bacterium]